MFVRKKAQGKVSRNDPSQDRRLVVANIIEARGLLGVDKKGLSNPHVVCSLIDLSEREVRSEKFVTQPVKGNLNPTFAQTFSFGNDHFQLKYYFCCEMSF